MNNLSLLRQRQAPLASWLFCSLLALAICLGWCLYAGKDLHWDFVNYHLYAPKNILENRLQRDFFAGGFPSYQNGMPYIPFLWMMQTIQSPLAIGLSLAAIHALNLLVTFRLSLGLCDNGMSRLHAHAFAAVATIIAALYPVFLAEVGSTYADVTTSIFVMLGITVLLGTSNNRSPVHKPLFIGGIFLGIATGLKLTNMIYLCFAPVFFIGSDLPTTAQLTRARLARLTASRLSLFGLGVTLGFSLSGGYWCWKLWEEFGNPFFPLFNSIFKSPDYPHFSYTHYRFLGDSWLESASLPFRMALPKRDVYVEILAPDPRFAIFFCLLLIALFRLIYKFSSHRNAVKKENIFGSKTFRLSLYVVGTTVVWILTTSNGRYAIPLGLLIGTATILLAHHLLGWNRFFFYFVALTVSIHGYGLFYATNKRWSPVPWGETWTSVEVPPASAASPSLYISLGLQSASFISYFLPRDNSYMNLGWVSVALDAPGGKRIKKMIREHLGATRILELITVYDGDARPIIQYDLYDARLSRLGLRVDRSMCTEMRADQKLGLMHTIDKSGTRKRPISTVLVACDVVLDAGALQRYTAKAERYEKYFKELEAACPKLFSPSGVATDLGQSVVSRFYVNSDIKLNIDESGRISRYNMYFGDELFLGTTGDMRSTLVSINCKLHIKNPNIEFHG